MKTKTEVKHTPTPWTYKDTFTGDGDDGFPVHTVRCLESGYKVACMYNTQDAAFIVRAVNSHEDLLDAVYMMIPYIEDLIDMNPEYHCYKVDALRKSKKQLLMVIAQAEGR